MSQGAKFTTTTTGHTHPNTPKVFLGPVPPTTGMVRGDIWVYTPEATTRKEAR